MESQGVHLAGVTQDGAALNITLEIIAPGVAHVLVQAEADPRRVTLALSAARVPAQVKVEQAEGRLRILSDHICLEVELDPFRVAFSGAQGTFLQQDRDTTIVTDVLVRANLADVAATSVARSGLLDRRSSQPIMNGRIGLDQGQVRFNFKKMKADNGREYALPSTGKDGADGF